MTNEETVPRPAMRRHSRRAETQNGHTGPIGKNGLPQSRHAGSTSLCSRAAAQNGRLSFVIMGRGRSFDMVLPRLKAARANR